MGKEDFNEEFLCSINFLGYTTMLQIFRLTKEYFSEKKIGWENCVAVCTDGAASMADYRLGAVAKIIEVAHKEMLFTHCIIHLEPLAPKN